ncbi:hypothetical protein BJ742DRAFT_226547 [Cladochytrium replicatum]|nr:hypothetical protein BJ742DRAFT_226547 [Cladochytrium replicatum]
MEDAHHQLAAVRELLAANPDDPTRTELEDLERTLMELVELERTANHDELVGDTTDEPEKLNDDGGPEHCCVAFEKQPGLVYFLPAIIISRNDDEATVLVQTPVTPETRVCERYLSGQNCDPARCRRSHGLTLPSDLIVPFEILETAAPIGTGARVVARYAADGVYYEAQVVGAVDPRDGEEKKWWVEYVGYEGDRQAVSAADLVPRVGIGFDDENGGNESKELVSSGTSSEEGEDEDDYEDEEVRILFHYEDGVRMGAWEEHTGGIGAKLLAKMGYVAGTGLGRNGNGRIKPVEEVVLQPGAGLGAEIIPKERKRKSKGENDVSRRTRRKRRRRGEAGDGDGEDDPAANVNVFDFINRRLNKPSALPISTQLPQPSTSPAKPSKSTSNVELIRIQQKLDAYNKELERAKAGKARNAKDKQVSAMFAARVEKIEGAIAALQVSANKLAGGIANERKRKQLANF